MIGGIPLVPVETEKKAVKKEYCAYCDMLGKPMQTITSHSLFSSAGVPICPTFREDGCKICHRKGDGAHLPRFCKKFVEKENTEFKKLGHYLFNLPTEKKSKLVIRDFGSHPKSEEIKSSTDPQIQEVHASSLKNLVVEQLKWAQKDRRRFDEERFVSEHQLSYRSDRREQRGGGRGGSKGGYDKGRRKPSNDQGSSRGGSRSGRY
uniref:Nanos-type domain-containing protein n=1 Tax=Panagrolaimus sp. JU765 TaxID=591449 RepID=A0AC34QMK6_9BILA